MSKLLTILLAVALATTAQAKGGGGSHSSSVSRASMKAFLNIVLRDAEKRGDYYLEMDVKELLDELHNEYEGAVENGD